MTALLQQIRTQGPWRVAIAYGVLALVVLATAWLLGVEVVGLSPLYVRLLAVFALLGLPMVALLAWAIREPPDRSGKGHVVREE